LFLNHKNLPGGCLLKSIWMVPKWHRTILGCYLPRKVIVLQDPKIQ
jgi:hypothetical protein